MKNSYLLLLIPLAVLFILSGCTQPTWCGDGTCNTNEDQYNCPQDCGYPEDVGYLEVTLLDVNTSAPIVGAQVEVGENLIPDGCGIKIEEGTTTVSGVTNEKGVASFTLASGKEYYASPWAEDYEFSLDFNCAKIYPKETSYIQYELEKLPPKPQCQGLPGTQELAVGDTIKVAGVGAYAGQTLTIELVDYVVTGNGDPHDWQNFYQGKWSISDENGTLLDYEQHAPPTDLKDEFGTDYFTQHVYFQSNCWIKGEDYPRAVVLAETCTDSDGGANIYEKGTIDGPLLTNGTIPVDYCALDDNSKVIEYGCSAEGGLLGTIVDGLYSNTFNCLGGCVDGACVKEVLISSANTAEKALPSIGDQYIVWEDKRKSNWDIYYYSLIYKHEASINPLSATQEEPNVSGSKIVWQDFRKGNYDIYLFDTITGQEKQITTNTTNQMYPSIDGDYIVWADSRSTPNGDYRKDIYLYDLVLGQERRITTSPSAGSAPSIYGNKIVWEDRRNPNASHIYIYDLTNNAETQVTTTVSEAIRHNPKIFKNLLVWSERSNYKYYIYLHDLERGETQKISASEGSAPSIYGDKVVWRSGTSLYAYDLTSGIETKLVTNNTNFFYPIIFNNKIVYEDLRNGTYGIYLYTLSGNS